MSATLRCEVPVAQPRLRVDRQSGAANVAASTGSVLGWTVPPLVGWVEAPRLERLYAGSLAVLPGIACLGR
jgi:hypothetical protein